MEGIVILILYAALLIAQITFLVKTIKSNNNKHWMILIGLEIIVFGTAMALGFYYDSLPGYGKMPGFSYMGEVLFSFGAALVNVILLFISICAWIIQFERAKKRQGEKSASPLWLILATIFMFLGIFFLGQEILENQDKRPVDGVIVGAVEEEVNYVRNGVKSVEIEERPVIRFYVDGKEYEDDCYMEEKWRIGDEVKVYYWHTSNDVRDYRITYLTNNKCFYIPLLVIGLMIIFFRFQKGFVHIKIDK